MTSQDDFSIPFDSFCIDPIFGDIETEQWLISMNPDDFRWAVEDDRLPVEKPKEKDFLDVLLQAAEDLEKEEIIEEGKVEVKKPLPPKIEVTSTRFVLVGASKKKKAPFQSNTLDRFFSKKGKSEMV